MTLDQIDRMVRQANPVPDLTALEPVDASVPVLQQRRTEMQTHDRVKVEDAAEKPRRGLLIGFAAAAVVAIGALILIQTRDAAPVANEPPAGTAAEVATAYLEAYAAFDIDRALSYLATDAQLPWPGDEEGVRLYARLQEGSGFKYILDPPCEERGSGLGGTLLRCNYDFHGLRSDEIGLGPFTGSYFLIRVLDGEIISVSGSIETNDFGAQMWDPFREWVAETHPDDVLIMYTNASQTEERVTEESVALWELRTKEYVAAVKRSTG